MLSAAKIVLHKLFNSRGRSEKKSEEAMGFFEHLEEFRKTLFRCCAAFGVSAALSLIFYKDIFRWLQYPLRRALELDAATRAKELADAPAVPVDAFAGVKALWQLLETGSLPMSAMPVSVMTGENMQSHMQILKLIDVFTVLMDVVLFGGIALSGPFILAAVANFVSPALTSREKRLIAPCLAASMLLFFAGAALSFFWLMPISIEFAIGLSRNFGAPFNWTAADYYSFVVMMTLLVGLVFEFPLVVVALQYLEITSTRWLFSIWRVALIGILIVAVVFTPLGDPLSVCILTGVLFGLYIISILVGDWLVRLKRRRALKDAPVVLHDEEKDFESDYHRE